MREANRRAPVLVIAGSLLVVGILTPRASVGADERLAGAWNSETWSTEGWPTDPPFTAAGRAAQDAYEADPLDDPVLNCVRSPVANIRY